MGKIIYEKFDIGKKWIAIISVIIFLISFPLFIFSQYTNSVLHNSEPIGAVSLWITNTAPDGYLICRGQSLLKAGAYANLYAVIGTTYGSVDGTHFSLPDLQGRSAIGVKTSSTPFSALGISGGSTSITLALAQLPAHLHATGSHNHTVIEHSHAGGSHAHAITMVNGSTTPHTHTMNSHAHGTQSHTHDVHDPTHQHGAMTGATNFWIDSVGTTVATGAGVNFTLGAVTGYSGTNVTLSVTSIAGASVGSSMQLATLTITGTSATAASNTANTGLTPLTTADATGTTASTGTGTGFANIGPYETFNYIIKYKHTFSISMH